MRGEHRPLGQDHPRQVARALLAALALSSAAGALDARPATAPAAAPAATIWVAPEGDDAASGDAPASALRTLGEALRRARPGTTVRLTAGTWFESVRTTLRGEPDRAIAIVGEGRKTILSGDRTLRWGLWLEASEHVVVEGIDLRDFTDIGLVVVASTAVTLRRLRVLDNGFAPRTRWVEGYGMHLDSSADLLVERNVVARNGPSPRAPDEVGTGINAWSLRDSVIRRNRARDNHGGGILVEDSEDVLVKRNRIDRNDLDVSVDEWWDGGIWVDGGRDIRLIGNRLRNNLGPGIEISDEDCQTPSGYLLRRNVSTGNYWGIFVWNFGTTDFPAPPVLTLQGNDFSGNERGDLRIEAWRNDCRRPVPRERTLR